MHGRRLTAGEQLRLLIIEEHLGCDRRLERRLRTMRLGPHPPGLVVVTRWCAGLWALLLMVALPSQWPPLLLALGTATAGVLLCVGLLLCRRAGLRLRHRRPPTG
ncbi:hypothetical protein [Streptomyces sp. NPDC097619]|uniref:hypothetical protein n=1 Tax=Streptomyces sp. NPDC097619 TaxID=3157228 RepID=UPI00332CB019